MNRNELRNKTITLQEAAEFLGFRGVSHLREKAKAGKIPGAFKVSNRWMFFKDDLIDLARNFHKRLNSPEDVTALRNKQWQSTKRKTANITTHDFRSAESECKNLLAALRKETHKGMKKNDAGK